MHYKNLVFTTLIAVSSIVVHGTQHSNPQSSSGLSWTALCALGGFTTGLGMQSLYNWSQYRHYKNLEERNQKEPIRIRARREDDRTLANTCSDSNNTSTRSRTRVDAEVVQNFTGPLVTSSMTTYFNTYRKNQYLTQSKKSTATFLKYSSAFLFFLSL